jgi:glutathione S-transferase
MAASENAVDFNFVEVNTLKGQQFAPSFVRKNPKMQVPVLV